MQFPHEGIPMRLHDVRTGDGDRVEFAVLDAVAGAETDLALLHVHGKGGNFYGLPFRAIAPRLNSDRIVQLSVNMRCHDLGYTRTDVPDPDSLISNDVGVAGGWWEKFSEGVDDLAAVTDYVRSQLRIRRIVLVGHSAGGLYSAVYAAQDPSVVATIQLSPLTSNKTNLPAWFPEESQQIAFKDRAVTMIAEGRGHHILPIDAWFYGISAATFLERVSEMDDLWLSSMARIDRPALVLWGSKESRSSLWSSLIARLGNASCAGREIGGAEHNYIGFEDEVTHIVEEFLKANRYFQDAI